MSCKRASFNISSSKHFILTQKFLLANFRLNKLSVRIPLFFCLQEERIPGFSRLTYVFPEVPVPADQQAPRFDLQLEFLDGSDHGVRGEQAARLAPQPVQLLVGCVRSERRLILRGCLSKAPFVMGLFPQDKSSCIYCLNTQKKHAFTSPHLTYFFPTLS